MFFNCYLSNEKNTFVDNSRVEPTIFFMDKLFSLKLFSGRFFSNPSLRLSEVLGSFPQNDAKLDQNILCVQEL